MLKEKNAILTRVYNRLPLVGRRDRRPATWTSWRPRSAPYIADTVGLVHEALEAGQHVLLEGAQATFLDLDHGTYPFVTSSNPVAGGACTGAGIGPRVHRPGDRDRQGLHAPGSAPDRSPPSCSTASATCWSSGATSSAPTPAGAGAPGWLDAVMLRHAVRLNSLSELAVTKLDVLDTLDTVKVCVAYEHDGDEAAPRCRTTSRCCTT